VNVGEAITTILGLPAGSDPYRVLGLRPGQNDPASIDAAVRRRMAQILSHPLRNSDEAEEVRAVLRRLARALKHAAGGEEKARSVAAAPPPALTAIDRAVLAVLVGEGGWNRRSRARLVAVAAAYRIPVDGLVQVLESLADAARSGGGPLSPRNRGRMAVDRSWTALPGKPSAMSRLDDLFDQAAHRLTPELREPGTGTTIKMAVLFGLLVVIAMVLGVRLLLSSGPQLQDADDRGGRVSGFVERQSEQSQPEIARLDTPVMPTFAADDFPPAAAHAADRAARAAAVLAELEANLMDQLHGGGGTASAADLDSWRGVILDAATSWPYLDGALLERIQTAVLRIIGETRAVPSLGLQLLEAFPAGSLTEDDPVSLLQSMWSLETFAVVACSPNVAGEVRDDARRRWQEALPGTPMPCDRGLARAAVLRWHAAMLARDSERGESAYAMWELWLAAVDRNPDPAIRDGHRFSALSDMLAMDIDLTRESRTRNIIGRLLASIEWQRSGAGRDALLALIEDAAADPVDLWAITSMLVQLDRTSWVMDRHVVPPSATMEERRAVADLLAGDWPVDWMPTQHETRLLIPVGFSPELVDAWVSALDAALAEPQLARRFAMLRRLDEAAVAIWQGHVDHATRILEHVTAPEFLQQEEVAGSGSGRDGYGGGDGVWSEDMQARRSDGEGKMELLDKLMDSASGDLGRKDADTLARAALTDNVPSVRRAAAEVIVSRFPRGERLAVALLDNLSLARSVDGVAALVADLTGVVLPPAEGAGWRVGVRRALVQHAFSCRDANAGVLDAAAEDAAASCLAEATMIDPSLLAPADALDPLQSLDTLTSTWRRWVEQESHTAIAMAVRTQRTATFRGDDRGGGSLHGFLRGQLDLVELLGLLHAQWRGLPVEEAAGVRSFTAARLAEEGDVVGQLVIVEQAIATQWREILSHASFVARARMEEGES
jgi:hypothetical protein